MGGRIAASTLMGIFVMLISSSTLAHAEEWNLEDFYNEFKEWEKSQLEGIDISPGSGSSNEYLVRPTFGLSHESNQRVVDSGFKINNQTFAITDNFHTPFPVVPINIGEVNSFEAKIYAEKKLKIQEFLFGIPNVGEAHHAELGVEVWFDYDGEIADIKAIQKSNVVDKETLDAAHEMTRCQISDFEEKCDLTEVSMIFLEPLKDNVMALKAIDYKNRYQITYLNEGVDIIGESINPSQTVMIPSPVKGEGLIQLTQISKYSSYWISEDGRIFEKNNFGSFKQTNQSFKRFQDVGNAFTREHSSFGKIIAYEQKRALKVFDSSNIISKVPDSFSYEFSIDKRINQEMDAKMLEQEQIAKKYLENSVQARFH